MIDVAVVAGARTPFGKFQGMLSAYSAVDLGVIVVREVLRRSGLDPSQIDECILGNVISAGLGQNPARQAALLGGLPDKVAAFTINKVCGSGLKAVDLGVQAIQTGNAEIVIAGGMESMTNAPYLLPQARKGFRMGDSECIDSMIRDGLWDAFNDYHMGITAENVVEKHSISRVEQDRYALQSHQRAATALTNGYFQSEVVSIEVPVKKGSSIRFDKDEAIRTDLTPHLLANLKPVFRPDGTVTAGNASSVSDGAAALMLMSTQKANSLNLQPLAIVRGQATSGVDPKWVMLAPVTGIKKLLAKTGWSAAEVDLYELNEAFAVQALGVLKELDLSEEKVNVNGGALAIGHPLGASGARVLLTLINELNRRKAKRGIAALCLGGGNSIAMAVERSV